MTDIYISLDKISYVTITNRLLHLSDLAQLKFISHGHKIWWESSGALLQLGQRGDPSSFHLNVGLQALCGRGREGWRFPWDILTASLGSSSHLFFHIPLTKTQSHGSHLTARKCGRYNLPVSPERGKLNGTWWTHKIDCLCPCLCLWFCASFFILVFGP